MKNTDPKLKRPMAHRTAVARARTKHSSLQTKTFRENSSSDIQTTPSLTAGSKNTASNGFEIRSRIETQPSPITSAAPQKGSRVQPANQPVWRGSRGKRSGPELQTVAIDEA